MKAEEQEGKEREKKEGEISVRFSRTRVCARAFQPQCCFFAVTSVTQREENRSKFDRKVRKFGEIEKKNNEEKCVFLCGSESFLDDYLIRLLNFPQRQPITT